MQVGVLCLRVEHERAAQVDLCFLKATQRIENQAEVGMGLIVIRALLYRDADCLKRFLVAALLVQGIT